MRLRSVLATREGLSSEEGVEEVLTEGATESIGDLCEEDGGRGELQCQFDGARREGGTAGEPRTR